MSFIPGRIRGQVNVAKTDSWINKLTGQTPEYWRAFAIQVELAFFVSKTELMDLTSLVSITVEIHDNAARIRPALVSKQADSLNIDLTVEDWNAGTDYHCKANFDENDMDLDLGGQSVKTFWIFVHGINTTGDRVPLGGTTLKLNESGASRTGPGPTQGGNLVAGGSAYDGSGNFVVAVTAGKVYEWTKSTNDTSIVNGTDTYTTSQRFTAQGSSVTLKGTAGAQVTAQLRYPIYPTLDELTSVLANKVSRVRAPGDADVYVSKSGKKKVTVFCDDNGNFITQPEDV